MKVKRSNYYLPFKKESEFDGAIGKMIKGGFVHQTSSGIYAWLNLGLRSLEKTIKIVEKVHEKNGVIKVLSPMLQEGTLWEKTGRDQTFGNEMLKIYDRNNHKFIFGPTAEELFCSLLQSFQYNKQTFPLKLYNIQWKFRDEIRPRFGIIRGREFLMKDAYSFHKDKNCLLETYEQMFYIYREIFTEIGFEPVTLHADVGLMGGFMSHEFLVPSEFGETELQFKKPVSKSIQWEEKDHAYEASSDVKYAEIGHIYALGDKYTSAFKLNYPGTKEAMMMGCYGIGVSRIVGLMFEKENLGPIAPFDVTLISISNDEKCKEIANKFYDKYDDIIWDDREDVSIGSKYSEADLIGSPLQIIIAPKELENEEVIIKKDGKKKTIKISEIF
ncbi:aminoacyl--tRNA ligase-related protein [Alphaproteobacteria bacterium endosymbiont of Tiliacea citrago]|uniref:aminoacyl--tRNA ligase-related protein n=1 Tax=Alphaproteobacteria bacterium endosymbiont of Tiliacea citrago TaxID=3077944 RepID=UPI00313C2F2D